MEKIDGLDINNELESEHYPKDVPVGVGACIRSKRCESCEKVYFTNNSEFKVCRKCK